MQNGNPHSLGVLGPDTKTGRPRSGIVVPANTPLPVAKGKRFTTARDGQTSVKVAVIEGGNATGQNSTLVGECVVRDLPEGLPKGTQVDVIFTYRENGRLEVRAKIPALNRKAKLVVQRESGLNDDRLEEWKSRVAEIGVSIT
ncbi:MAG: Hsp70 family protein [Planctomycetes bacterium]|nr:Hsp70 family protein [Planctomycetota bacterium]